MNTSISAEIDEALGPLIKSLAALSVVPVSSETSSSFGNFVVSFRGCGKEFQIARDRGQFIVHGPAQQELELADLWRTFPGFRELAPPLIQWLRRNEA
jgi:hypothetical protein